MVAAEKDNGFWTIGKVASIVGVSPSTLRLLEAQAGISPYRTENNLRLYDKEMVDALIEYRRSTREQTTLSEGGDDNE